MDIHPFTNHDIAKARAAETVHRVRDARRRVESDLKPPLEGNWSAFRRLRRRRAAATTQLRAT
jgi:hypothetical protein